MYTIYTMPIVVVVHNTVQSLQIQYTYTSAKTVQPAPCAMSLD